MKSETIKLYFDANNICLGSYEYQGNYYANDFFKLDPKQSYTGKSLNEIKDISKQYIKHCLFSK